MRKTISMQKLRQRKIVANLEIVVHRIEQLFDNRAMLREDLGIKTKSMV